MIQIDTPYHTKECHMARHCELAIAGSYTRLLILLACDFGYLIIASACAVTVYVIWKGRGAKYYVGVVSAVLDTMTFES